jgi:hypothetical protein
MAIRCTSYLGIIVLILFFPASSLAITANDWKDKLSEGERVAFVMGLNDAWQLNVGYNASKFDCHDPAKVTLSEMDAYQAKLISCSKDMTYTQMKAIISKYVDAHPEAWHEQMAYHAFLAIASACK